MGWLDTALTIATTVGKIAGTLSGASAGRGVDFGPRGDSEDRLGQAVFYVDQGTGQTNVMNQSSSMSCGISIPTDPTWGGAPIEILLAPMHGIPISPAFNMAAGADVDSLTIIPVDPDPDPEEGGGAKKTKIHEATTRTVLDNVETTIGSYVKIKLAVAPRTALIAVTGGLTLAALILLNVRGAGDTTVRLINAVKPPPGGLADDATSITIAIPPGVDIDRGLTFVEVLVAVGNLTGEAAARAGGYAGISAFALTDEHHAILKAIADAR